MNFNTYSKTFSTTLLLVLLTACGGGGGSDSDSDYNSGAGTDTTDNTGDSGYTDPDDGTSGTDDMASDDSSDDYGNDTSDDTSDNSTDESSDDSSGDASDDSSDDSSNSDDDSSDTGDDNSDDSSDDSSDDTSDDSSGDSGDDDSSDDDTPSASFPSQQAAPSASVVNDQGSLILAESGLSLYTFDNDTAGTSNCAGAAGDNSTCAGIWPPLLASDGAAASGNFSLVARGDGTNQWAYNQRPLYTYINDVSQGDVMGDGIGGTWHLARPIPVVTGTVDGLMTYVANQTVLTANDSSGSLDPLRSDKHGFTLYTFDNDPLNASVCAGACITAWPPLLADSGAQAEAPLSIVDVADGQKQWAYKGKPLYFWIGDSAAGHNFGDEQNNVWQTATLEPAHHRTIDGKGRFMSATGLVNVLMPVGGSNTEFEVQEKDMDGFALYTFDADTANTSNCENACLVNWPAFVPSATDEAIGDFTIISRSDGTQQWALNGNPLYFYIGDTQRSDINGNNVGGVWHLVTE